MKKDNFERVDMRAPDYQDTWVEISRSNSLCFRINQTDPMAERSCQLVQELLPTYRRLAISCRLCRLIWEKM